MAGRHSLALPELRLRTAVVSTASLSLLLAATAGLCLGQMMPPSDSAEYAAKVVTATGSVSVLRDSQPWALSIGDQVQVKELILTGPDGHALFQVSDGSTFEVFPNSHLVFRKNPPNWKDLIDVLVGRVRVHIEHWGNIPNPNRVLTPTAVISVRGTTFDVSVEDDDETTTIEVEEGIVDVQHALLPRGNPTVLTTGETLRVYKSEPLAQGLVDKGTIVRQVLHSVMDAVTTMAVRRNGGIGSIAGGNGGVIGTGVGDTQKVPPPPSAPPPPTTPTPPSRPPGS